MFRPIFIIAAFIFSVPSLQSQPHLHFGKKAYSAEVYFDFGKHALKAGADTVLTSVSSFMADQKNVEIRITAHTDSIGSLKNNLALSNRRSHAVKEAFMELGIADSLVQIDNFGETTPVANNHNEKGRQRNRRATIDIVKYPIMTYLTGRISNPEKKGIESTVIVRTKGWRDTIQTDSNGMFKIKVPVGFVIGIDAFSDCHFFETTMLKTKKKNDLITFELKPATNGETMALNNLYFIGGRPILMQKSKPELPKILRFMESNLRMKIEIAGHVNVPNDPPVTEQSSEFRLSENRARVVHDYLLKNGIEQDRITFKGYGNWEMRFPNANTSKEMAVNRRVEMKVLKGGCD